MKNNDDLIQLELEGEDKERYLEIVNARKEILQEYREQYEQYVDVLHSILLRHKSKYDDEDVIDTRGAILESVFSNVPPEVFCRITNMDNDYIYKLYKGFCTTYGLEIPRLNRKELAQEVLDRVRSNR